jgi:putative transposase
MRTSKFMPEQMVAICRQGESGLPVVEVCREHGISEQTNYEADAARGRAWPAAIDGQQMRLL